MKATRQHFKARSIREHGPRFTIAALSSQLFILASLAGCGDDSVAPGGVESTDAPPIPTTSATTDDASSTSTGELPPEETSTTEEIPTTGEEPTTGPPAGCLGLVDGSDDDADGVANADDNCPCDANPNQLDFDGDAIGNVCDAALKFALVDGTPPEINQLKTTAHAKKTLECDFAVDLMVRDGVVEVELDDTGMARLHLSRVSYVDTPELTCDLGGGLLIKLRVQQFIAEGLDSVTVGFPFALPDHQAGILVGVTDAPHAIVASAIINVTGTPNELLLPLGEEPLMDIPGVFPTAVVSVSDPEQEISLVFADEALVLFEKTTETGITFKLTGLTGTLRLKE